MCSWAMLLKPRDRRWSQENRLLLHIMLATTGQVLGKTGMHQESLPGTLPVIEILEFPQRINLICNSAFRHPLPDHLHIRLDHDLSFVLPQFKDFGCAAGVAGIYSQFVDHVCLYICWVSIGFGRCDISVWRPHPRDNQLRASREWCSRHCSTANRP